MYLFIKLKTYPSDVLTIIHGEQVFTNHYKSSNWSLIGHILSSLQFAEHADHLFTSQGPSGAQEPRDSVLGRWVTIVHSVELCFCHTLIVWISICTEVSDTATLMFENWSQILIPHRIEGKQLVMERRTLTNKYFLWGVLCTVCFIIWSIYLILQW